MDFELVVHGHFYQPPREDPWTGEVAEEHGAAPDHDWNERINAECYRPNAVARVFERGAVARWHNNYAALSFDVGPTLARWLERHEPLALRRMIAADREQRLRYGRGNALAHPYFHSILPLCDPLDRATLVRWGIAEFRHRFRREPEGMWLPETAADNATLATLAEHGVAFAVLAPTQAARVRPLSGGAWRDVHGGRVDPSRPYRWRHPDGSGRGLALFFFDGELAHGVAFGSALASTEALVGALAQARRRADGDLVHLAVDGETFGHHQGWGERVIAHALFEELPRRGVRVTSYAAALARRAPRDEVELDLGPRGEGTAWSCAHGVGRWLRDCGCRLDATTRQQWREPLRAAFDLLRERARGLYLDQAAPLLVDAWVARDGFIDVLLAPTPRRLSHFLARYGRPDLRRAERLRALRLLDLQFHLLAMDTSCGWFFDDVAGLESVLVMRHAARALDLWDELAGDAWPAPRADVLDVLAAARSNRRDAGSGADVFRRHARPSRRSVVGPPRPEPLLEALRLWIGDGGEESRRRVLDTIASAAGAAPARVWQRAQELLALAVSSREGLPPGGAEIAAALGFAPEAVAQDVAMERAR
jgi:alpha-amylase/alpha-mannosidase (GH57 family)